MELENINKYRAEHYKARKFEDILEMYTENCMFVIEHMPPGIGKKGNLYKKMDDQVEDLFFKVTFLLMQRQEVSLFSTLAGNFVT